MTRKKGKKTILEMLKPYLITIAITAGAMVVFMFIWLVFGEDYARPTMAERNAEAKEQSEIKETEIQKALDELNDISVEPLAENGSDRAGIMALSEEMLEASSGGGLQSNDLGSWYEPAAGFCYYNGWVTLNGEKYHFDSEGYMDTGWTAIAGSGYYFDESGVYDPDKDSTNMIAFTFDDGPSQYTSEILDILEKYDIQATFMMVGSKVDDNGAVIPRVSALGNTIGNHSYSHIYMSEITLDEVLEEFFSTDELIASYGGESKVVRFPYGDYTDELVTAVGKPHILWGIDSEDWSSLDASTICELVYASLYDGCIILMHDIYSATVEAFAQLVPELLEQGYNMVNIEELAASRGYELEAGVSYSRFTHYNTDGET